MYIFHTGESFMQLDRIINEKLIFLNENFSTANDVIQFIGNKFEECGYCTANYTNAMLKVFNDYPGVIVLDDGIAMPHARPEEGALKNGLAIVKLCNRVDFNNEDFEKVNTVIGLCSTGSDTHIELIQLIGNLIENNIQNALFTNKNDVLVFINNININMEEDQHD